MDVQERVAGFMKDVLAAMGLSLDVQVEDLPEGMRIELSGEGGEVLLRRKGEALDALQQIVDTGVPARARRRPHFVVDCMGFRKGKDAELRQMARFIMDKARERHAAGNGPAQSVRAPHRAPDRRRRSARCRPRASAMRTSRR